MTYTPLFKKLPFVAVGAAFTVLATTGSAQAITLKFDDLPRGNTLENESPIPNGYGGLDWDNFYYFNPSTYNIPSGYQNSKVSSPNVAYNGYGAPAFIRSSKPFTFNSVYLTSVWYDDLMIWIFGANSSDPNYFQQELLERVFVNTQSPTLVKLNWVGVDRLYFYTTGGTPSKYNGVGPHFAMDNFTLNEPTTATIPTPALLPGLIGLGVAAWRKRKAAASAPTEQG